MKYPVVLFIALLMAMQVSFTQEVVKQELEEVTVTAGRIDLPFSKNSRTIKIISSEEIKKSGVII